ncbi:DVUA0089 family protein [Marinobacter sp. SS21]|uniref:DVUA0089 family protein n=1 Tax=Marinobacter sp. SS21 TaxID=2979460 RepID=UPI00232EA1D1|nr:DVUA0089 family protein [Marinobacter sp. SS21]MDC0662928.1 DVUA0089 family protein [Marinobacter sp. SS21]
MNKALMFAAGAALAASTTANAALINFTGSIEYHNDVIYTYFSLEQDATNVRVWTDSFQDGTNFDPITALWNHSDGSLLAENDDDDSINPATQTIYDSGFAFDFLAAGDYVFTVATYNNWALGNLLSDGFTFDGQDPIALADWNQPANGRDMGPNWSVWLDGVDSASNPDDSVDVPEPGTAALFGLGLLGLGLQRGRRRKVVS